MVSDKEHAEMMVHSVLAVIKRLIGGQDNEYGDAEKAQAIAEHFVFEQGVRDPEMIQGLLAQMLSRVRRNMKPIDIIYDMIRFNTEQRG